MTATFSELIGFSRYGAIANDALKDEDNAAWVMQLEPTVQQEWVERSRWILLVDHLAESEYLYGDKFAFQDFQTAWKHLLRTGTIRPGCVHEDVFAAIYDRWFAGDFKLYKRLMIYSWDRYVRAMHTYHQSHLVIHTMKNYETLLAELGGTFFQIFPFLGPKH